MILTFRPIDQWPDGWRDRHSRPYSPFRSGYHTTLELLDREGRAIGAPTAILQVDATPGQVRRDGQLRADANVGHPGVILTIDSAQHGTLVYRCDRYEGFGRYVAWQANLRAIALGLEALRKVDRYGIAEMGQQYAGFNALPPATPMGAAMTRDAAAALLAEWASKALGNDLHLDGVDLLSASGVKIREAWRDASRAAHPDAGGDPEVFRQLTEARDLLLRFA